MEEEKYYLDLARRADRIGRYLYTDFLDPLQAHKAEAAARQVHTPCQLFGGYEDAERCIACFGQSDEEPEWPFIWVKSSWNAKFASPGHRDFLGALMGLGIKREAVGDILMQDNCAYLALHESVADYVFEGLTSAGRASLNNERVDSREMLGHKRPLEESEITVSSMRLDALVAAGARLSRAEAERLIAQGAVKVDHLPELRPDRKIQEQCLLSVTGFGRLYILKICGTTKRGRMRVSIGRPV